MYTYIHTYIYLYISKIRSRKSGAELCLGSGRNLKSSNVVLGPCLGTWGVWGLLGRFWGPWLDLKQIPRSQGGFRAICGFSQSMSSFVFVA